MNKYWISSLFIFLISSCAPLAYTFEHSDNYKIRVINAIIGEAENQGYNGMLAVACAIRNRGSLNQVYGEHSDRILNHLYSSKIFVIADRAWEDSRHKNKCLFIENVNSWYSKEDLIKDEDIFNRCTFIKKVVDQYFFYCKKTR